MRMVFTNTVEHRYTLGATRDVIDTETQLLRRSWGSPWGKVECCKQARGMSSDLHPSLAHG